MIPTAETAPGGLLEGRSPDEALAAAFAQHVARWARSHGASPAARRAVQHAARRVSQAVSDGHSCVTLDQLLERGGDDDDRDRDRDRDDAKLPDSATLRTVLLASKVVGTPESPAALPLILDRTRLYLHRYYDYECRLAANLVARNAGFAGAAGPYALSPDIVALLDRLFSGDVPAADAPAAALSSRDAPDWQKIAAMTALLGRLTIISGGPGTGKTTTVVNLLACLLAADPDCRIALAAPTGKAAARMTEVILQRAAHLPENLRARLPTSASTIHRLLGSLPNGEFRHHAGSELPIDVLVVDEASMLDLALAVHLLEAVPSNARIILLGDKDQLAAVESGAVFSELSARPTFSAPRIDALSRLAGVAPQALQSPTGARAPLEDGVIWLRRNYRFAADSAIGLLAGDINAGHAARVVERLRDSSDPALVWLDDGGSVPSPDSMRAIVGGYAAYVEALRLHANDPRAITMAFAGFRVLCALRDGPWGVNSLNREIGTHCRRTLQHALDPGLRSEWYPGRPVMVLRNDPVLKLFNGDIGIVLPDAAETLQVWFPDEGGGFRAIAPVRLPDHETAYAMTVHKSQGSEFDTVLLVLPAVKNRILTRELLYTAVTRARRHLTLVANASVVAGTIDTVCQRVSGLLARLDRPPP